MSSAPIQNVMVLGASGSVGPHIVEALLAAGFTVSALTRTYSQKTFADGVRVVMTDYTHESLVKVFKGQDAVVSTIATFSTQDQIKTIDAAIAAKVRRFLPSEFGLDTAYPEVEEALPPAKPKRDTVGYLRSKEDHGLSWTAVIVGAFFDWGLANGALGINAPARTATIVDGGNVPYEATNIGQIGRAVAAILSSAHFEETANQYVYINSFTVTQNEVVGALEAATGNKFKLTHVNGEEFWTSGREQSKTGKFVTIGGGQYLVGSAEMIWSEIYNRSGFNQYSKKRGLWNKKLDLPEETFEETIRKAV